MHAVLARLLAGLLIFASLGATPKVSGATAFLQVPGVTGTATGALAGDIPIATDSIQYQNVPKQQLKPGPLHFTKDVDVTSPVFADALASGKPFIGDTILHVFEAAATGGTARVEVFSVKFHNAVVKSNSTQGNVESISLTYDGVQLCVTNTKGNVCTAWDFIHHTPTYP